MTIMLPKSSFVLSLALLSACACLLVSADTPCISESKTFTVKVDLFASELGYYSFEECEGVNPTIGIEIGETYTFVQQDISNYYHPLGFAYFPDGAHDGVEELEPGIAMGSDKSCQESLTCPAPMYFRNGTALGTYSNLPSSTMTSRSTGQEDFGLDAYEPLFFHPPVEWKGYGTFDVKLNFDDASYDKDIFYFCHIHSKMSGRIKLLSGGEPVQPDVDEPEIPYSYDQPGEFDSLCGTFGLDDFQLPHSECPERFVCDATEETEPFSSCIDAMNCAMMVGMTTKVSSQSEIALFIHQMIPHHQNAVNMAKALLNNDDLDCDDISNDEDPHCVMKIIMYEIINGQNKQIQDMRGVLDALNLPATDDCVVDIANRNTESRGLQGIAAAATGALFGAAAHLV